MGKKGFSIILLVLLASLATTGIIVASFVSLKHQGYFTQADRLDNLPQALPGSQVEVAIDPLSPVDAVALLDDPQVAKLTMKNYHGDLEIDTTLVGTDSAVAGKAAVIRLPGDVEIKTEKNYLELSSKGVKALTAWPIIYNKNTGQLSLGDNGNQRFIYLLPNQAAETSRSTANISIIKMELVPDGKNRLGDNLVYKISGRRTGNLFGVYRSDADVEITIGGQSGLVLETKEPIITKLFSP